MNRTYSWARSIATLGTSSSLKLKSIDYVISQVAISIQLSLYLVSEFESYVNEIAALLANNAVISYCEVGMAKVVITINGVTYTY